MIERVDYRIGDYASFRAALLRARTDETALANWHPTADGDLAVQLLEWWAYLADVLAFYNERALTEALLGTADAPEDLRRIVRLLGYRPRPGIGATGVVAAMTDAVRPFTLPRGWPIQATMGTGLPPQIFEADADIVIGVVGQLLPASARFPSPPGGLVAIPGYATRDTAGRLRNTLLARGVTDELLPPVTPGTPVIVTIDGVVTNVQADDTLLLLHRDWDGVTQTAKALVAVSAIEPMWDSHGKAITILTLNPGDPLPAGSLRDDYKLLTASKSAHLWLYHDRYPGNKTPTVGGTIAQVAESIFDPGGFFSGGISTAPHEDPHALTGSLNPGNVSEGAAHLEAIVRGISSGDPVLFEKTGISEVPSLPGLLGTMVGAVVTELEHLVSLFQQATKLVRVTRYAETIWYANPPENDRIGQGPPIGPPSKGLISGGATPIPIPHSVLSFDFDPVISAMSSDDLDISRIIVHYDWQEVGMIVPPADAPTTTTPDVPATSDAPPNSPVIVEDATGAGTAGWIGATSPEGPPLVGPLQALLNLVPVSRGQTIAGEVLGNGDPTIVGQELALARSPLTYLADPTYVASAGGGYRSTLRVHVSGIEWHEVASFYGQPTGARVFVTREDDSHHTFVQFGDGVNGARLPAGTGNVIADYRIGSGAAVPPIGALTTILRPLGGLDDIRNPIAPGGGADPDPPDQIRRYAPRSVLAFGRAISGDDYETIAEQTPGVNRARVVWDWDPDAQRTLVKVFVGDDDSAVAAVRAALRATSDPNRPIMVALASPVWPDLTLTLEVDPDYDERTVQAAVTVMLLDPLAQPFGTSVVRIEQTVYDSQIYDACMSVPGVIAVHDLAFRRPALERITVPSLPHRRMPAGFDPRYAIFELDRTVEVLVLEPQERHVPGTGAFYLLRGDRLHITTESARHG